MSTYRSRAAGPASCEDRGTLDSLEGLSSMHDGVPNLIIRSLGTIDEYHACERIQHRVWDMADELEIVPLHMLVTVQKNGGLLLGAFEGNWLLGFVFGFPGLAGNGRLKHCSHMMGVVPEVQSGGVGYQLKLAQREFVLAQGLDLVTWTYDPLESRNAYLNLHKLGALSNRYLRDLYGTLKDGLNAGLPTDRFEVDWWITSERVRDRLAGLLGPQDAPSLPQAIDVCHTSAGWVAPNSLFFDPTLPLVEVEIPADYRLIRAADPGLALEWRQATRQTFEFYFNAGYTALDFMSCETETGRRSSYLLQAG